MKRTFIFCSLLLTALALALPIQAYKYQYSTVDGDPINTLEYTLPNGLKIFMSVNKDQPRIQAYIPVRVGGKNDPAETTGLAHYFEHLMFKGTKQFGTQNYAAEQPMLDQIEALFEKYRMTSDSAKREAIYHDIDSISYQASLIAIPNEYDKLMASIGANGTNAYTSTDVTCYVENIPSNEIENWAMIQADRFKNPVLRGFHTELETIYEEKNMSLTSDSRKAFEAILSALYPSHPYGTQTVLGTQEHLKNPSITNVKNYHKTWYVPNNMAICLSGDFDPDNMVDIITKYFGDMEPNTALPVLNFPEQPAITSPIVKKVTGVDAEMMYLAWRLPAAADKDMLTLQLLGEVLQNGKAGIIDKNISLPQLLLSAGSFVYDMADGGALILMGQPKEGQTLDDVRNLLTAQIDDLRNGNFSDDLVQATINNMKLMVQQSIESNEGRADYYVQAFTNRQPWADFVADFDKIDKITKADIVAAANKYLAPEAYVAVYKVNGPDPNEKKIAKPKLTPIATNRDAASDFLKSVQTTKVEPIQPVFIDFDKDLTFGKAKNDQIEVIYTQNNSNDIFQLTFVYDFGSYYDRNLSLAAQYLGLVGTPDMTAEQVKEAFYKLACTYFVQVSGERTYAVISGLAENMDKAVELYEKLLNEAVADADAWKNFAARYKKSAADQKLNQRTNFSRLTTYARYGSKDNNPVLNNYTPAQVATLDPAAILKSIKDINNYSHSIIYYGPDSLDKVIDAVNTLHRTPGTLAAVPQGKKFVPAHTDETIIYVAPYEAKQLYMSSFSNRGIKFDADAEPQRKIYNEYFGGGMNSIVFQEMRESRSLAYSAYATMAEPEKADREYIFLTQIATQNDKMADAIEAFLDITDNMPQSQAAFNLAKDGLDSRLRTERIIKDEKAWAYISAKDKGLDYDPRAQLFEALPGATLADVIAYQQKNVKGNIYNYAILGKVEDLDMEYLKKLGKVIVLTTEDIFGY